MIYNGRELNDDGTVKRQDLDEFYLKMSFLLSERSTCLRRKVGAVIVRDKEILSAGFNGSPCGSQHCSIHSCERIKNNLPSGDYSSPCMATHAEMNAIINAAKNGVCINGATLYVTTQPCIECAKAIANSGIKKIVYSESYGNGISGLEESILQNIEVVQIDKSNL